jgi:hypothetical protein
MDIIFWIAIGLAVYFHYYTLAAIVTTIFLSFICAAIRAEIKHAGSITCQVVVGLLRKDIADPETLRQSLKDAADREAAVASLAAAKKSLDNEA